MHEGEVHTSYTIQTLKNVSKRRASAAGVFKIPALSRKFKKLSRVQQEYLVKITESLDHSQNKFFRDSKLFGQKYSNLMTIFSWPHCHLPKKEKKKKTPTCPPSSFFFFSFLLASFSFHTWWSKIFF